MSVLEQQELKKKYYSEAMRYMENAKENLIKAKQEGPIYRDSKYVKTACGVAYNGVLTALDCFLILKEIPKPSGKKRKSIDYYQKNLNTLDGKMLDNFNITYKILHLSGYYDGIESVKVVKEGFSYAYKIIEKIKPCAA